METAFAKPGLLVLAAGLGTRFGSLKQLEPLGPHGESLLDYSVFDAVRAGFGRVVFVLGADYLEDFKTTVAAKYSNVIEVACVCQTLADVPPGFAVPPGRVKPWGTLHAVLAARDVVDGPFAVINADDFYGRDAFARIAAWFNRPVAETGDRQHYCMVAYRVDQTLSGHGGVNRGLCMERDGYLIAVEEHRDITADAHGACHGTNQAGQRVPVAPDAFASINIWGFTPSVMGHMAAQFAAFVQTQGSSLTAESYLPALVDTLVHEGTADCRMKGGSGDLINRLKAEKGRPTADVLFSVSTEVIEANTSLFTKFTPDNAKFLADAFKINDAAVPFTAVATSIGVNTKQLTPAQYPKSWTDLANPMFKGKLSAARPDKSGSAFIQLAIILQIYGEDNGWELYARILDNAVLSNSSGAVPKFVNDGEAAVGLSNEDSLLKFKAGGGPVEILYPADGTSASADVMALTATPNNAAGGRAFINFMLSREAQEILDSVGRRSVRTDVVSKNPLTPLSKIKLIKYNDDWAGANRNRILAKWNDLLLNKK